MAETVRYAERLWPSPTWWGVAALAGVGVALCVAVVVAPIAAVIGGVIAAGLAALALVAWAARIEVDAEDLRAGDAYLPYAAMGPVSALDSAGARLLRGTGGDPRGYLVLRSYVPSAVRVDIDDPADPAPYWYVSTRHPELLAAALTTGRAARDG